MSDSRIDQLKQDIVFQEKLRGHTFTFHSTWGLFNPRRVDQGSRLLVEHVQAERDWLCLDIGCGYGPIGLTLAHLCPEGEVHLVDKDFVAVEYARQNARLNGLCNCRIYLSNAFSHVPDELRFDLVASNLPAKAGNELLSILLHDAHQRLKRGGRLYVVTISGLKEYIRRTFREVFGTYEKVKQGKTHTVSLAVRE
jgi:16S rRNA G1207 methylase RsmC